MKTPKGIQRAIQVENTRTIISEVSALPLGYILGGDLTVTDTDVLVNPLIVNVDGKQITKPRIENARSFKWVAKKKNDTRYYLYLDRIGQWSVDSTTPVYVEGRYGTYNPRTLTRNVGTFYVDEDGNYVKVIYPDGTIDMEDNPIIDVNYIDFNLENGIPAAEGRLIWNNDEGTLNLGLKGGNVNLQIGQEQVLRAKNTSGATMANGAPVRVSGASGNSPEIGLSDANDVATRESLGLTTEEILNNQFGYVTTFGLVRDLDTTGPGSETWSDGDRVYVSNTAGELTNVLVTGASRKIFIGIVLRAHATEGVIWVHPLNIYYIEELSGNDDGSGNAILNIDTANQRVGINTTSPSQALDVVGNAEINGNITLPAATTETRSINIGIGRTGNGLALMDFIGDATYTDYGLRIIRNSGGANTSSQIQHRGTGVLDIRTIEAAKITFSTTNTKRMEIDSVGNLVFTGNTGAGLAHGSMYNHDTSTTVTIGATSTAVRVPSGFLSGVQNLTTFQNAREIVVTVAGHYKIDWSISFTTASANQEIEGFVMIDNTLDTQSSAHRRISTATDTGAMGGTCILDLAANAVVALGVLNETSTANVIIEHSNLSLVQVGS